MHFHLDLSAHFGEAMSLKTLCQGGPQGSAVGGDPRESQRVGESRVGPAEQPGKGFPQRKQVQD